MKKLFTIFLALFLVLSLSGAVFAEEATTGNRETDVTYDAPITTAAWEVTVPVTLAAGKSGDVVASGTWGKNQNLSVTTDPTVRMYLGGADNADYIDVNVQFLPILLQGNYVTAVSTTETVSIDPMSQVQFGTWKGTIEFDIDLQTDTNHQGGAIKETPVTLTGLDDGAYLVIPYTSVTTYTSTAFADPIGTVEISDGSGTVELFEGNYILEKGGWYWNFKVTTTVDEEIPLTKQPDFVIIETKDQLEAFAKDVTGEKNDASGKYENGISYSGKTVYLGKNIDLGETEWSSIGSADTPFSGTFDGQGYTISNLKDAALFGTISETGVVKNLKLKDVSANAPIGGFLVKSLQGKVESCSVQNAVVTTVSTGSSGLVGTASGNAVIDKCSVNGFTLTVTNTADNGDKVGGLVGFASGAGVKITNSDVSDITLNGVYKTKQWGGFVGFLQSGALVEDCTATTVKITVSDYYQSVGGFVGAVADSTITGCDANGVILNIGKGGHAGGFCGYTGQDNYYIFEDCHVTGLSITANKDTTAGIGGFSGRAAFTTTIKNCSAEGDINASEAAISGGLVNELVGQDYVAIDPASLVTEGNIVNVQINKVVTGTEGETA